MSFENFASLLLVNGPCSSLRQDIHTETCRFCLKRQYRPLNWWLLARVAQSADGLTTTTRTIWQPRDTWNTKTKQSLVYKWIHGKLPCFHRGTHRSRDHPLYQSGQHRLYTGRRWRKWWDIHVHPGMKKRVFCVQGCQACVCVCAQWRSNGMVHEPCPRRTALYTEFALNFSWSGSAVLAVQWRQNPRFCLRTGARVQADCDIAPCCTRKPERVYSYLEILFFH